ncbi:uncharacterized protein LOC124910045 [Impatiens glandulifera]|uniref:uncharacterized protein LOC124910045 n=1 Tax=Impatiens glandulifera TaxID=253017 RepID=UPI001FB07422|nr:uncharacterized protein LOC124910045 [Impatiens glandulifera]
MERAMKSQFQYLLKAPTVIFSGTIIHQMLIRKSSSNSKGISFLVNGQQLYWGMKEYALVTGLNFGRFPVIENWNAEEIPPLVHKYFGGKTVVKVTDVQSVFLNCSEKEDAWKLGLINLIYQCLFGSDNRKRVCLKIFSMVEDMEMFLQFPWGKVSFNSTLKGIDKDMKHLRQLYVEKKETCKGNCDVAYTISGFAIAFQVWTYLVMKTFVPKFADMIEEKHTCPRILLFTASRSNTNTSQEVSNALFKCNVFNKIHESEEEKRNYCGDDFEEMGDYIYDDLFEVDGRKRKNEDGTPKQTPKRRTIKRTAIKMIESSDESSEDSSRSTTRESTHVPSATSPQKKEDSSPTRQDKFDNPVTKAQNDDKFDELTKDVKELTRDVKELKTEMKVMKEDQRVMFKHIIQLLDEIKQQKNDVSAADMNDVGLEDAVAATDMNDVEKDLEINKDVADENDDVDDLPNEKEDAADMNDVGLEDAVVDGLEMITNDDVGLEDAVVDGLEMINNAAVVDDDKDSSAVDEAVVDDDQNKDAYAVDGLEMNKEAVETVETAVVEIDDEEAVDEEAVDEAEQNVNKDEEAAAVVDKNVELGKKELATKKKRKNDEEDDMGKKTDEEAELGKKKDDDVLVLTPTRFQGQSFRRKKRSTQLGNYTDPNGKSFKLIDLVTVNPLLDYDSELLDDLKQWMKLEDDDKINLVLFHAGRELFNRMLRPQNWLHDQEEIDAAYYILKKRVANFPKTYQPMDFSICDCNVSTRLSLRYSKFSKNPQTYTFDDDLMEYFRGDEEKLMTSWMIVDKIYFPMNLNMKHWVLCEVQLQDWCINVYDCEQGFIKKNQYDKFMKPLCKMIPYLFLFGTTEFDRIKYPKFSLEGMSYVVIPHPRVPKCTKSGDCGLFTIMYLEYLTAKLDISAVTSENIVFWRQKWAVRLFHHIIDP